jgi:hypothetical protein
MNEERENSNIWEDALDKVNTPPLPDSWKAMEGLLDVKMPPPRNNRYWSWLLVLLLLLLTGVCYFRPSSGNHWPVHTAASSAPRSGSSADRTPASSTDAAPTTKGSLPSATDAAPETKGSVSSAFGSAPTTKGAVPSAPGKPVSIPGSVTASAKQLSTPDSRMAASTSTSGTLTKGSSKSKSGPKYSGKAHAGADASTDPTGAAGATTAAAGALGLNSAKASSANTTNLSDTASLASTAKAGTTTAGAPKSGPAGNAKTDTAGNSTTAANTKNKSTSKSAVKPASKDAAHKHGFAVGIGLNQFFALGDQSKSNLNADGTTGTLSDYLPIPEVRYYFRPQLYLQLEAQFNTPQYTKPNLVASQNVVHDTFNNAPLPYTATSVYIQKLYYFNLPLSVHYSPIKHLFLGAGIEYAKMTNGVALFQQFSSSSDPTGTGYNPSLIDTIHYSKLQSFKGDSIYKTLHTQEFRVLFDANFQWKGFTLGLRYNQALERFINVQISSSQVTQARNSSLQLYLRYTLWRQKALKPYEW